MRILAGDIGGTKTLLEISAIEGEEVRIVSTQSYRSSEYRNFGSIAREFLGATGGTPDAACFAVAGPVRAGRAKITNLPWSLDSSALARELEIPRLGLVNDMQGVCYGVDAIDTTELETLQAGEPEAGGTRAIIAAGTGLGQGAMVWQDERYVMHATEGGHVDFAPRDDTEIELLRYLMRRYGQVSYEMLVSGPGLTRIYEFLRDTGRAEEPPALARAIQEGDPAAAISAGACAHATPIASLALERFVRIYGAQAGNLALNYMATGGVYVAGGIALKIMHAMTTGAFVEAFDRNAAMSSLLARIPVHVVRAADIGLRGARTVAQRLACEARLT